MKYYFFRDLDHKDNFSNERTFHAAGIVDRIFEPNKAGKDFSVSYFNPFTGYMVSEWRAVGEIELFEVDKFEHELLLERYAKIDDI